MSSLPSRSLICRAVALVLAYACGPSLAWVYPEHRDLSLAAVQWLDGERRAVFDRLWQQARLGHEARLCESGADSAQGVAPMCIDWAAFAAIAGDHSCSSRQMLETAEAADWILAVADVAAQLKVDLARVPIAAPASALSGTADPFSDAQRRLASEAPAASQPELRPMTSTMVTRSPWPMASASSASSLTVAPMYLIALP